MRENLARVLPHEHPVYRVVTQVGNVTKIQRWDLLKPLFLPAPLNLVLKEKDGNVYWGQRSDAELSELGPLSSKLKFKLEEYNCRVVIERIQWANFTEAPDVLSTSACLYYLQIQGTGSCRARVASFNKENKLCFGEDVVAQVEKTSDGISLTAKRGGLQIQYANGNTINLQPAVPFRMPTRDLSETKFVYLSNWWKFKPIYRSFDVVDSDENALKQESSTRSYLSLILSVFLVISAIHIGHRLWKGIVEEHVGENEIKSTPPVVVQTANELKLPDAFVKERKVRLQDMESKQQAILGDGKIAKGSEGKNPVSPGAAKGNGLRAAINGGALGTMKSSPKNAAKIAKTNKIHVAKGAPADAIYTQNRIKPMALANKAGASTRVVTLDSDQTQKILERKAESLKAAFGSVLGYLNDKQAPDDLSQSDPDARADRKTKRGGLVVAADGAGSGNSNDDQVRVLGQVGTAAGKGIVGGTGGPASGVTGGYGLSTRFKGSANGAGIGGASGGNLFVDFDALDQAGDFSGSISEGLTKAEVGAVIHAHSEEIRQCYENALLKVPSLNGKWIVDFTISPAGLVSTAKVAESPANAGALSGCLIQHMKSWTYPKPRNGVIVQVDYPFSFRTIGGAH